MESFMPHGYCLSWNPQLLALFVIGNTLVTLAYYSIPASIIILVSKRHGLVFHWMFILFAAFIFVCGTTHLVKIWTIWHADYWLEASLDALTGVLSMVTAFLLWPLVPKALALASPEKLEAEIVQRKKAESKFRALLESAPDAIVIVNEAGEIVLVNAQTTKMFGYPKEEMLGQSVQFLIPEQYRETHSVNWSGYLAGEPVGNTAGFESFGQRADRSEIPVEISLGPLQTDEGVLVSIAIRDISLRKAAENQLRDSEERFRLLVTAVSDYAIIMIDVNEHVVSWNPGAERIEGYTAEEIIGKHFSIFYPEEDVQSGKPAKGLEVATTKGHYEEEGWRVRKDGTAFYASVLITSIKDENGKLRGFAKVTRDITERMQAEESQKQLTAQLKCSNQELHQFAYVVAHDLREPLRSMSTFGELLASTCAEKLDAKETEFLSIVLESTKRLQQLITDLLAYCRIEQTDFKPVVVDTAQIVDQVLKGLYVAVEECQGKVDIGELPPVCADQVQLGQLFQNLIANAVKYRGDNPPQISISGKQEGTGWLFSIADNGIGFDMKFSEKIFEPFQRLHAGGKYPGTGIGLAICKKIVERHGGKIWAQTRTDQAKGTTFSFTIPAN